jgi:uncharacterized protein (TIGR03067 family)
VDKNLPARPNLDHLRRQAKTLLKQLAAGNPDAKRAFVDHLPALKNGVAALRLADAQSVVARQSGYASWPALSRHVEQLRGLEGEWHMDRLELQGTVVPSEGVKLLMDGDRFRVESVEATYEGVFTIDVEQEPAHIDIEFVSGPEAGETIHGIYTLAGDALVLCLGLVGAARPTKFASAPGSQHALEHLHRASAARPAGVTGGTPPAPAPEPERGDPAAFDVELTDIYHRLAGEWSAVELATDGRALPPAMLAHGKRTMTGNEIEVVFGGQTMVHAKVRIDETQSPIAIDYLGLSGRSQGVVTRGIMEWAGDDARFLMAPTGAPRPTSFAETAGTLSRWRRRG